MMRLLHKILKLSMLILMQKKYLFKKKNLIKWKLKLTITQLLHNALKLSILMLKQEFLLLKNKSIEEENCSDVSFLKAINVNTEIEKSHIKKELYIEEENDSNYDSTIVKKISCKEEIFIEKDNQSDYDVINT